MIRRNAFWIKDKLSGGRLAKSLQEVTLINEDPYSHLSIGIKEQHLLDLLEHSVSTTSFYKDYKSYNTLKDFPVINKNIIRQDDFLFKSSLFRPKELKQVSTSGSTGIPFSIQQNSAKVIRNRADNLFYSQSSGYRLGTPLYYLRIWNSENRKSRISHFLQNTIPVNIADFSEKSLYSLYNVINKLPKNSAILAYGSTYEFLADFLKRKDLSISMKPKVALVMSESLNYDLRMFLSSVLNCPIYSRYSNAENGFFGHQYIMDSEAYLMNTASYHFEFLAFEGQEEVKEGEPGRVVITDFFNYSMPLIRYDTGDIAIKGESEFIGNSVPIFKSIEGRKLDFIKNVGGDYISPHTIDYALRSIPAIIQFQLIQKGEEDYLLKLLVEEANEGTERFAKIRLQTYLGKTAKLDVKFVEEIPILSSGKRKIVINELIGY